MFPPWTPFFCFVSDRATPRPRISVAATGRRRMSPQPELDDADKDEQDPENDYYGACRDRVHRRPPPSLRSDCFKRELAEVAEPRHADSDEAERARAVVQASV